MNCIAGLELAARDLARACRLAPADKGLRAAFRYIVFVGIVFKVPYSNPDRKPPLSVQLLSEFCCCRKHAGAHEAQREKDKQTYGGMLSASPSARVCPGVRVASHRLASPRIGLTPEETPLPSNSPHDHKILRVDLHGRWKRPCLQTAHMTI